MIIFSAATAWFEAAAGIYLRTLFGRPGLYQPNLLTMTAGSTIAQFEAIREAATLTLLVAGQWNPETQAATAFGARNVMITDISEYKLEKARQCGVKNVVNPQKEDLGKAVLTTFGLNKADLILECVGTQDTITQAISNARKGTTIVVVGVFGKKTRSGPWPRARLRADPGWDFDVPTERLRARNRTCGKWKTIP